MSGMFAGATSFNQNLNNWNVQCVTNMSNMFNGATSFNGVLNGNPFGSAILPRGWHTNSLVNASGMFADATSFNQKILLLTTNVTDMSGMFAGATSFNQNTNGTIYVNEYSSVLDIISPVWDVRSVKDVSYMFAGTTSFNNPLNNWLIENTSNMSQMFVNSGVDTLPPWY